jgi:hypothetical protein
MFVAAGCSAFIGYSAPVPIENASDAWLTTLITCDAQIEYSLLKGKTVAVAVQDARQEFNSKGLDFIGELLVCNPANCGLTLPSIGSAPTPALLADRVIPLRELPAANVVAARTI